LVVASLLLPDWGLHLVVLDLPPLLRLLWLDTALSHLPPHQSLEWAVELGYSELLELVLWHLPLLRLPLVRQQ
jgi:hypothetical protein